MRNDQKGHTAETITVDARQHQLFQEYYNALSHLYDPRLGKPSEYVWVLGKAIIHYMNSEAYNEATDGEILEHVFEEVGYLVFFAGD
jgi:hypothetical protein